MFKLMILAHFMSPSPTALDDLASKYQSIALPFAEPGLVEVCVDQPSEVRVCREISQEKIRTKDQPADAAAGDLAAIALIMKNAKDLAAVGYPVKLKYSSTSKDGTQTIFEIELQPQAQ